MESIELKSPEVHEILNRPPKGLVRWGSGLLSGLLMLFFIGSYFFSYPEVIEAKVVITTLHPPVWLKARATATISELIGNHLMKVKKGQLIAVLENPSNTRDVLSLKGLLTDSTLFRLDTLVKSARPFFNRLVLGELQPHWTNVVNRFTDYLQTAGMDNFDNKQASLLSELKVIDDNLQTLKRKERSQKKALIIEEDRFRRDEVLFEKGLISLEAFQLSEQALLAGRQLLEETHLSVNNDVSEKYNLLQTLENESLLHAKILFTQTQAYLLALKELVSALETWEQTYLLISPVDGTLTFPENRNPLQQIQTGDKLFAVVPDEPGPLQAYLKFPVTGSGKVRTGQTARLFIDGYPYLEYGTLTATIRSISLITDTESAYTAVASVPDPLQTNYGIRLEFRGELTGTAQIRTRELRLIQRIINPLKYLVKSQP